MIVQTLKWIGNIVAAAVAGAIVSLIGEHFGSPAYYVGMIAGMTIMWSLYILKPSPKTQRPAEDQRTQSARRYRQTRSARQAQNR